MFFNPCRNIHRNAESKYHPTWLIIGAAIVNICSAERRRHKLESQIAEEFLSRQDLQFMIDLEKIRLQLSKLSFMFWKIYIFLYAKMWFLIFLRNMKIKTYIVRNLTHYILKKESRSLSTELLKVSWFRNVSLVSSIHIHKEFVFFVNVM